MKLLRRAVEAVKNLYWRVRGVETITVDLGYGFICRYPVALLERVDGGIDNDNEHTTWVEYWLGDRLVHRSVHVRLKKGATFHFSQGSFG